jgi:hypothetical protein
VKKIFLILNENEVENLALMNEFSCKKEFFETEIISTMSFNNPDYIWKLMCEVISKNPDNDFLIFCTNDFIFSPDFSIEHLDYCIAKTQDFKGDLLLGSTDRLDEVLEVDKSLFWINNFENPKFIIVFKTFFNIITNNNFDNTPIQYLTENIFLIYPLLSKFKGNQNISETLHLLKEVKKFYHYE